MSVNRYRVSFSARRIGALGTWGSYVRLVDAPSEDAARLALYDEFEHITVVSIERLAP